jgi:hypothetical protein
MPCCYREVESNELKVKSIGLRQLSDPNKGFKPTVMSEISGFPSVFVKKPL